MKAGYRPTIVIILLLCSVLAKTRDSHSHWEKIQVTRTSEERAAQVIEKELRVYPGGYLLEIAKKGNPHFILYFLLYGFNRAHYEGYLVEKDIKSGQVHVKKAQGSSVNDIRTSLNIVDESEAEEHQKNSNLPGGAVSHKLDRKTIDEARKVLHNAHLKHAKDKILAYSSQVVAGTNHLIVVEDEDDDEFYAYKIFQSLPGSNHKVTYEVKEKLKTGSKSKAFKKLGLPLPPKGKGHGKHHHKKNHHHHHNHQDDSHHEHDDHHQDENHGHHEKADKFLQDSSTHSGFSSSSSSNSKSIHKSITSSSSSNHDWQHHQGFDDWHHQSQPENDWWHHDQENHHHNDWSHNDHGKDNSHQNNDWWDHPDHNNHAPQHDEYMHDHHNPDLPIRPPVTGGWSEIAVNPQTEKKANDILQHLSLTLPGKLVYFAQQTVAGFNYKLVFWYPQSYQYIAFLVFVDLQQRYNLVAEGKGPTEASSLENLTSPKKEDKQLPPLTPVMLRKAVQLLHKAGQPTDVPVVYFKSDPVSGNQKEHIIVIRSAPFKFTGYLLEEELPNTVKIQAQATGGNLKETLDRLNKSSKPHEPEKMPTTGGYNDLPINAENKKTAQGIMNAVGVPNPGDLVHYERQTVAGFNHKLVFHSANQQYYTAFQVFQAIDGHFSLQMQGSDYSIQGAMKRLASVQKLAKIRSTSVESQQPILMI